MRDYRKIRAFQLADEIVILIYKLTRNFPKEEIFGLTSQMRRAAISMASNIVEGSGRDTDEDFVRFLDISFGSLRELDYQYSVSYRLGYLNDPKTNECSNKINEAEKVLAALIRKIRNK